MKRAVIAILCTCLAGAAFSADIGSRLSAVLPAETVSLLVSKGQAQKSSYREKGVVPRLAPATPLALEATGFWSGNDAAFFVETLYLYKKNTAQATAPGADVQKISAILRSLSKLQGIEYYSTSRKKMRTLYEKSYTIGDEKTKTRVPDRTTGSADGVTVLALQKDLTFGEYVYSYAYRQNGDTVAFFSQNTEQMNYTVLKVLDPGKLRVSLIVQDLGDYLLVYGLTRADFPAIPAIADKLNASFTTRADAVYKWFIREYEKQ